MSEGDLSPIFAHADVYEKFMGRWCRRCGKDILAWLGLPRGPRWLDVGCRTGTVADCILADCTPADVAGIDPAESYLARARATLTGDRARFDVGGGRIQFRAHAWAVRGALSTSRWPVRLFATRRRSANRSSSRGAAKA